MKKVILEELPEGTVLLSEVNEGTPIFAVRDGVVIGILIKEVIDEDTKRIGWIVRIVKGFGSPYGYFPTREDAIRADKNSDFYIEIEINQ